MSYATGGNKNKGTYQKVNKKTDDEENMSNPLLANN